MIARLHGTIIYKSPPVKKDSFFIIDVQGVGYQVSTTLRSLEQLNEGEEVKVYTYFAVSEYAQTLYGFLDPADKSFFEMMINVPGIGPKTAIGILEKTTMGDIQQAVVDNSSEVLVKMCGLGEKTADKILIAFKDKVAHLVKASGTTATGSVDTDVFDALVGFGYSAAEAQRAVQELDQSLTDSSQKLRAALKLLARN